MRSGDVRLHLEHAEVDNQKRKVLAFCQRLADENFVSLPKNRNFPDLETVSHELLTYPACLPAGWNGTRLVQKEPRRSHQRFWLMAR